MITVKCGREEIQLGDHDEVMYNGACYQITTKRVGAGWNASIPLIAKAKAVKLIKEQQLTLARKERGLEIYKLNVKETDNP